MEHLSKPRTMRKVLGGLVVGLLLATQAAVGAPTAAAAPGPNDWLGELNLLRSMAGLPKVSHVSSWSSRNVEHARWMVYNNQILHGATPATPWYTVNADIAGQRSNLSASSTNHTNRTAVDGWMTVPFHGIGLIDPKLTRVGFGTYYDANTSGIRWGAGLDFLSDALEPGRTAPPPATYPVVWPKAGSTLHLTTYGGAEIPDPLTHCPGYSSKPAVGVPLYVQFAAASGSVSRVSLTRMSDGKAMPRCWFDGTSYKNPSSSHRLLGRAVLASRNAVIVMPDAPLQKGQRYRLVVVRGGVTASSTFTVGSAGAPPPVNPIGPLDLVTWPQKGSVRVAGWTADWDAPTTALKVYTYVDGKLANSITANRSRSDVAAAWPELGAKHGFDVTFAVTPGQRRVCVTAVNVGAGKNKSLGCRDIWIPDPLSPFLDVLSTSLLFDSIVWMVDNGYTTGFLDGTFKPKAPVTRQAMARFLYVAAGSPAVPEGDIPFSDVPKAHLFYDEIKWMVNEGITTGYKDGTFRPADGVTRQATAAFLWRMEGEPEPSSTAPTFSDIPSTHLFYDAISWLAERGITTGYDDGTFQGSIDVSRQQMAAFLHRWRG